MILIKVPYDARPEAREQRQRAGVLSLRFGKDEWWYGEEQTARAAERGEEIAAGRLHVVTQIGDAFQRTHPDVRIVANYGRYLLADIPPATAERIRDAADGCFRVEPVEKSMEVFRVASPPAAARRSATAGAIVDRVSRTTLQSTLTSLAALQTRHSTSATFFRAVEIAEDQLRAAGYTPSRQTVNVGSRTSLNVVAELRGTLATNRRVVIVAAHLDSVNLTGGAGAPAPGADDNASGAAGVLEIARALAGSVLEHDIRFILFGGEEQGLHGSIQYVASLSAAERTRIAAVVNMDMIGTRNRTTRGVLLEGASLSASVIDALSAAAAAYAGLEVTTSLNPFNSDHVPFIDAGIPAVLTIEAADSANTNIHTANDTIDRIDYDLLTSIVRMNTGFVAERAGARKETAMPEITTTRKISGRYDFNGGVMPPAAGRSANHPAAVADPRYRLMEPEMLAGRASGDLRFTLHIDVDGTEPLNVVSGVLAAGTEERHFIGRATQTPITGGVRLSVRDFSVRIPGTSRTATRATIDVTESTLTGVIATVTFQAGSRKIGPFTAKKVSSFFGEIEIDVDREVGCADVEPMSTHVHPDRPADIELEELTLETVFARAGFKITRASDTDVSVPPADAGEDHRWTYQELHDSMTLHWQEFANRPQWKMWVFFANRAVDDGLGGVMFDANINEPGGVDRQGTALFTRCPYFHTAEGGYITANPPADEAIKRELFFNLIHETGHAFNLAHSFDKGAGGLWNAPSWSPAGDPRSLSWLNYPDQASNSGGANATWFYSRFRNRFDDNELLFLRHAPRTHVQMGAETWFTNHGRTTREEVDPRLQLVIRHRKEIIELGEPVLCELKLKNVGHADVAVHAGLDPSEGFVELAVTSPSGVRTPFISIAEARRRVPPEILKPGASLYDDVDLTVGLFGFPFKEPGPHRIEATYRNLDGRTAAAVTQIYVRPAAAYEAVPAMNDMFRADVGRVLYCEGTEVLNEVNDRLAFAEKRLSETIGPENPVAVHLRTTRYQPLARKSRVIRPDGSALAEAYDPERFVAEVRDTLVGNAERAADTMGHIWFRSVIDQYCDAAMAAARPDQAYEAQNVMHQLFSARGVVPEVVADVASRAGEMKKRTTSSRSKKNVLSARNADA